MPPLHLNSTSRVTSQSPLPEGERVWVRGARRLPQFRTGCKFPVPNSSVSLHFLAHNPSPRPSPSGRGEFRSTRVYWDLSFVETRSGYKFGSDNSHKGQLKRR